MFLVSCFKDTESPLDQVAVNGMLSLLEKNLKVTLESWQSPFDEALSKNISVESFSLRLLIHFLIHAKNMSFVTQAFLLAM